MQLLPPTPPPPPPPPPPRPAPIPPPPPPPPTPLFSLVSGNLDVPVFRRFQFT
ncbi:unnamed protein product [Penicillium nalgiovense]|nr:unnamed protein product [Penicillium nalgiovense]